MFAFVPLLSAVALASTVFAAPSSPAATSLLVRRAKDAKNPIDDLVILQYALTLEHLENAFYSGALTALSVQNFTDAGFNETVRERFAEIGAEESTHVSFLQKAIGKKATMPCNYTFPYTDVNSFIGLAAILEGVGTSAYLGAAASITNKAYLTAAGAILTVEARHAAWIHSVGLSQDPFPNSFETPLGFSEVYSLAAAFITSCPKKNPALPFKAFPALTVNGTVSANSTVTLDFKKQKGTNKYYLGVFQGLTSTFVKIASDGTAILPATLEGGQVYGVVTTNSTAATDDTIVAGPFVQFVVQ